jgi:hypothetical protein
MVIAAQRCLGLFGHVRMLTDEAARLAHRQTVVLAKGIDVIAAVFADELRGH